MTGQPTDTPPALAHNVRYNKVLHQHVVLLTARTESQPYVPDAERLTVEHLAHNIVYAVVRYGFMETPP